MGTNSAPLLADLFLHTYEYEFIIKTMKGDITRALQFNKTFRYIDNLLCVNNDNFNKHINEIYPSELILKNTTTTPSETSYLDTTLNIGEGNGTVRISVYDKREDFNFKIVNFPTWSVTYHWILCTAFTYLNWWDMQEFAAEKMTSYTDTDVCF